MGPYMWPGSKCWNTNLKQAFNTPHFETTYGLYFEVHLFIVFNSKSPLHATSLYTRHAVRTTCGYYRVLFLFGILHRVLYRYELLCEIENLAVW